MGRGLATKSRGGQELKKACATEGIRLAPNLVADTVSELLSHFKEYPDAYLKAGDVAFTCQEEP